MVSPLRASLDSLNNPSNSAAGRLPPPRASDLKRLLAAVEPRPSEAGNDDLQRLESSVAWLKREGMIARLATEPRGQGANSASPTRRPIAAHTRDSSRSRRRFRSRPGGVRGGAPARLRASPASAAEAAASPRSARSRLSLDRDRDRRIDRLPCFKRRVALGVGAGASRFPSSAMTAV